MRQLMGMMSGLRAVAEMSGNYDSRKVARDEAGNVTVSTAWTTDEGFETAIIDSDGEVYPVQRYEDREDAKNGHKEWLKFANSQQRSLLVLGGLEGCVADKPVKLKR